MRHVLTTQGRVATRGIQQACIVLLVDKMNDLAIGFGEGAEMRRPLGIAIVGGLLVSQLLTLYTTPVMYLYLDRFRLWSLRKWRGSGRPSAQPVTQE